MRECLECVCSSVCSAYLVERLHHFCRCGSAEPNAGTTPVPRPFVNSTRLAGASFTGCVILLKLPTVSPASHTHTHKSTPSALPERTYRGRTMRSCMCACVYAHVFRCSVLECEGGFSAPPTSGGALVCVCVCNYIIAHVAAKRSHAQKANGGIPHCMHSDDTHTHTQTEYTSRVECAIIFIAR